MITSTNNNIQLCKTIIYIWPKRSFFWPNRSYFLAESFIFLGRIVHAFGRNVPFVSGRNGTWPNRPVTHPTITPAQHNTYNTYYRSCTMCVPNIPRYLFLLRLHKILKYCIKQHCGFRIQSTCQCPLEVHQSVLLVQQNLPSCRLLKPLTKKSMKYRNVYARGE